MTDKAKTAKMAREMLKDYLDTIAFLNQNGHRLAPGESLLEKVRNLAAANRSMSELITDHDSLEVALDDPLVIYKRHRDLKERLREDYEQGHDNQPEKAVEGSPGED